jgi:hypothetical protein
VSIEETTSSISVLRPFVRRREFLLDINDGVGRSNFFRYGLSDHTLLDRYWMIFVGCREEFFLTISILAAMSPTMVIFTLGSLAMSTRLSVSSSLDTSGGTLVDVWMTTLIVVRVHAALVPRLKLKLWKNPY